jgi:hypothetical protein
MTRRTRPFNPNAKPSQRPKELLPVEKTLLQEADRMVTIRSDGIEQKISTKDVLVRKMVQVAAGGSPHALGHFFRMFYSAQEAQLEIIANEVADGYRILERSQELLKKWIARGKDPKLCIPHPDDIIVTEGVGWEIKGPTDQSELDDILKRCSERDLLLAQGVLETRMASKEEWRLAEDNFELRPDASAQVVANLIDMALPKRFQLTFQDHIAIDLKYDRMTKRELHKYMRKAWLKAGKPVKRGARLTNLAYIKHAATVFSQTITLMNARSSAGRPMTERQIADGLTEQFRSLPSSNHLSTSKLR